MRKLLVVCLVFGLVGGMVAAEKARGYLKTGNWYPAEKGQLVKDLGKYFDGVVDSRIEGRIRALVVPHAGLAYSGYCAAQAFGQLKELDRIKRVILLGVSHRGGFYGACVSDFDTNATPLGALTVDRSITAQLAKEKMFRVDNRVMEYEHSLENQLPFLQKVLGKRKVKIVPILFGRLKKKDFAAMATIIKKYMDEKTLVVASSDLTHYGRNFGYVPFKDNLKEKLSRLDMGLVQTIERLDFTSYYKFKEDTGITMCGFAPVGVMIKLFGPKKFNGKLLSYYKSGDFNNDYSVSVSYAGVAIVEGAVELSLTKKEKENVMRLARKTLESHFSGKGMPLDSDIQKDFSISRNLKRTAGVFVTLKKKGQLRGCIGTIIGSEPIYKGVMHNVLKAALQDPRFSAVQKSELEDIEIEISVMTPLQLIDDYKTIRLGTDGVIIRKGTQQAVYLPQVATETGWDLDLFLGSLCRKAGLPMTAYRDKGMDFYIFQALVFHESEVIHDS
jgi:AmmeMemoRadiSam system protein B/AmmeMemoRadiSam system protein A